VSLTGFLSDWWRDFFALTGFVAVAMQIAALIREFSLARPRARTQYDINNAVSNFGELGVTIRQAYRETKKSNFHFGFHLFYFNLVVSCAIASCIALGFWSKDSLAASPLGALLFMGLACDVSDIDDWIKRNKPASLLHLWRLSAWLFGIAFALASALIFTFHVSVWLESFFLSQIIGVGAVLALVIAYYIARLFRLTD
jgi:hypothetical protein